MKIVTRHAHDYDYAWKIAQGMENAGATVFSVTHDGMSQKQGALMPSSRFIVWCKVVSSDLIDAIDQEIEKLCGDSDD